MNKLHNPIIVERQNQGEICIIFRQAGEHRAIIKHINQLFYTKIYDQKTGNFCYCLGIYRDPSEALQRCQQHI